MPSRRPKDYVTLSKMLGVTLCQHCQNEDHYLGNVGVEGTVHWADRTMRWPGLVRFLKLVAISRNPDLRLVVPTWHRTYALNVALQGVAKDAHTRIPSRYLRAERTYVKAALAGRVGNDPVRKRAYDWSRRESGQKWD